MHPGLQSMLQPGEGSATSSWQNRKSPVRFEATHGHDSPFTFMTARCRITTLELRSCANTAITGPRAEWLAGGVLAQCRALVHLDLSENQIGTDGASCFAGVLAQCPALAHLELWYNDIGTVGRERLRASWRGQAAGLVL